PRRSGLPVLRFLSLVHGRASRSIASERRLPRRARPRSSLGAPGKGVMTVMSYEEVTGWGARNWAHDVTGVAVDSRDRVYVLQQGDEPVTVFRRDGTLVDCWGHGRFSKRPHLISIGEDDRVYVADDGGHRVHV